MPENFLFTITFDNFKSYKTKCKLINNLPLLFQQRLNLDGELFYTIEYHKKSDKISNNYFRPHVHGVLYSRIKASRANLTNLTSDLKDKYGRILQFALQEDQEEVIGWKNYCLKDVEANEKHTGMPHQFYFPLQNIPKIDYAKVIQDLQFHVDSDEDDYLDV